MDGADSVFRSRRSDSRDKRCKPTKNWQRRVEKHTLVYQQENFQTEFENKWQLWQTLHMTLFTNKVKRWLNTKSRIKDLNINYSKEMAAQSNQKEKELEVNPREIWLRLTDEPDLMPTYSLCKKEFAEFQKYKIQRKLMKAKYDLMEKGDSGTTQRVYTKGYQLVYKGIPTLSASKKA